MIVVFGTINVDLVTVVPRFPGPGDEVKGADYQVFPGGKGANQALAARLAGAAVELVGCVGRDGFAEIALAGLRAAGVGLGRVGRGDGPTGTHMIAVGPSGENMMIGAEAANRSASADRLGGLLGPGTTLLVQTSLGRGEVERAITAARLAGTRIVLNAAPISRLAEAALAACDVIVVNAHEARALADDFGLPREPAAFARAAARRFVATVVVTLGAEGLVAATAEGEGFAGEPPPVTAIDATGAGDALIGAFAAALDRGEAIERALAEGLAAGALATRATGAQSSFAAAADIRRAAATVALRGLAPEAG